MSLPGRQAAALAAGGLRPGAVQVWWAATSTLRPEHDVLLAPADLERRARLARAEDRQRSTAAAAVVRAVLGTALAVHPAELGIDRTCPECGAAHGKPRLRDAPEVHLSVSHSGSCVVVAVQAGSPVGVDVEEVGRFDPRELDELAEAVLAAEERDQLARRPAAARAQAFTTYWTRKEAVLKATGQGLGATLDELVVSAPSEPPRVLRWAGAGAVWLRDLPAPPGFAGALAGLGSPPAEVAHRDAGLLLDQTSRRLSGATTRSQRYP
ncbi:4'-phosphopantetheinyl transferase family protein [Geodermatophilus sp. SYSU D00965]